MTVSTSDAKIDFVARKSYRFKSILDFSQKLAAVNNLTTLTAANENTMNVENGVAVTYIKV